MSILLWWGTNSASTVVAAAEPQRTHMMLWGLMPEKPKDEDEELAVVYSILHCWY